MAYANPKICCKRVSSRKIIGTNGQTRFFDGSGGRCGASRVLSEPFFFIIDCKNQLSHQNMKIAKTGYRLKSF